MGANVRCARGSNCPTYVHYACTSSGAWKLDHKAYLAYCPAHSPGPVAEDVKNKLLKFLRELMVEPEAKPFLNSMDEKDPSLSDYHAVIQHPMGLRKMEAKLLEGKYSYPAEFEADFKLICDNCLMYHGEDDEISEIVHSLARKFETQYRAISGVVEKRSHPIAGKQQPTNADVTNQTRLPISRGGIPPDLTLDHQQQNDTGPCDKAGDDMSWFLAYYRYFLNGGQFYQWDRL
eukprot:gb/GEZN01012360.1/.p1 GENE.gb/GEZN01012360.1/~~gb/GEZN01012360.1/.p1  ORF type:complete len:233 (-),score=23.60 gb/GEZN01012360.1/:15-713(-)